jgi:hypothetical protein
VYQRFGYHHKIVQLYGDSALLDFAPFDAKIDMAFVDGSHSYENVLSDSLNMLQLLRDGKGILVWHDYTGSHPGVVKALNRLYSKHRSFARLRHVRGTTLVVLIVH